jgi:hypothetical protein
MHKHADPSTIACREISAKLKSYAQQTAASDINGLRGAEIREMSNIRSEPKSGTSVVGQRHLSDSPR